MGILWHNMPFYIKNFLFWRNFAPPKKKGCSEVLLFPPKLQQSLGTWRKCFLWFPREHEACRLCCHIPLFTRDLLTLCVCVCFLGANLYITLFYFLAKWWRFITYKWTMIWLGNYGGFFFSLLVQWLPLPLAFAGHHIILQFWNGT